MLLDKLYVRVGSHIIQAKGELLSHQFSNMYWHFK